MVAEVIAVGRINIDLIMRVDKLPSRNQHKIAEGGVLSFGGSAANFAAQSALLGVKTGLVACVGNDVYGQSIMKQLSNIGVEIGQVLVLEKHTTGLFFVAHDSDGGSLIVAEPGANRFLERHLPDDDYMVLARVIHIAGGFPMATARLAEMTTREGMILSIDPGRAASSIDYSEIIKKTDLLFLNQSELKDYFGVNPSERALKTFAKTIPGVVIVKQGKLGAIATDGFEYCTSDVFEVPVVDTLGAGDAFAAGFVTAWTRFENIERALHMANAVAALTITKRGAQQGQPTLNEVAMLLREYSVSIDPILRTFSDGKRGRTSRRRK